MIDVYPMRCVGSLGISFVYKAKIPLEHLGAWPSILKHFNTNGL